MTGKEKDRHRANWLLAAVPAAELTRLMPHMEIVPLRPHAILIDAGAPLRYAYFPHGGVICLMAALRKGVAETATIGAEGFVGFTAILGGRTSSQRALVQMGGTASRLPTDVLVSAARRNPALRNLLLGYVRFFLVQVLQSVACNGLHSVRQRCARWLLMAHDRAGTETFGLTHQFLADMLGVQRPSITLVARSLQQTGLIDYRRGTITITDRRRLEGAACECYAIVRRALDEIQTRPAPPRRTRHRT
ncbi:MAG TPA: Crp/Fnr family transcriptional regulator [Stellaceae bacterium]|nr:Crp/Fnr family transcriptional regulator [Stellaceae bacterium]